jgi:pimeloyl-ACP methyl ester carboxylesterase
MRKGYADSPHGQIHYRMEGGGMPLVMIAPSKRSSRNHVDVMALLSDRYKVILPDTLGYGNSDPVPADATIDMLAEGVMAVLDELGEQKAHFYGLHTGNKIVSAIAVRWPQRVGKLVIAGQTHSIIPDQAQRNAVIGNLVKGSLAVDGSADAGRQQLKDWAALYRMISDVWWDDKLFAGVDPAPRIAMARRIALDYIDCWGSTRKLYGANFGFDLGAAFRRISVPTLILEIATPAEDAEHGRQGEAVRALIPGSTLVTLHEDEGHAHTLEHRAADLARVLQEFLG